MNKIHLSQILDTDELQLMLEQKFVSASRHVTLPYTVYKYSRSATYKGMWNQTTMICRGLVVDDDGYVVARPFKKFFNHNESHAPKLSPDTPVEVWEKVDGSLGILMHDPEGNPIFATPGSLNSEQALHAAEVYKAKHSYHNPNPRWTYLFEIVYPKNVVVVRYGDMDDLVLLGAVDKVTGASIPFDDATRGWKGPVARKMSYSTFAEALSAPIPDNEEGYIIHDLANDVRVKVKGAEYLRLHRIVTNLNERTVWELLADGKTVDSLFEHGMPEEFIDWATKTQTKIQDKFDAVLEYVRTKVADARENTEELDRKHTAIWVFSNMNKQDASLVIKVLYNGEESIIPVLWKQVRPEVS